MGSSRFAKHTQDPNCALLSRSHTVNSAEVDGIEARLVEVQARAVDVLASPAPWHKAISVAGMPRREASDLTLRIGAAMAQQGIPTVSVKIVLSFHPGGNSPALELPAAIAVMAAAGVIPQFDPGDFMAFGSLDVHGDIRHVDGPLSLALSVRANQKVIFPSVDIGESQLVRAVRKCSLFPIAHISEVADVISGRTAHYNPGNEVRVEPAQKPPTDFADIIGQEAAKRAAVIAAAGGHNLMMIGPPGCLAGETIIHDPVDGTSLTAQERHEKGGSFFVTAMRDETAVTAFAFPVVKYPASPMIKFSMSDGTSIRVTPQHRFWTGARWLLASELFEHLQKSSSYPLLSSSALAQSIHAADVLHLKAVAAEMQPAEPYFDFHVPIYNSYVACGLIHHNCGKTMIANAIAGILPTLTLEEKIQLTRIWSVAGKLRDGQAVTRRPFRVVHHTATRPAIIGGGSKQIVPGEITLAHQGVLFLDEIAEFKADTLDCLRQPMEDGCVRISRVHQKVTLPSRFSLVAAMNPCPCGYFSANPTPGSPKCQCSLAEVQRYQSRISGPMFDRIDIKVSVDPVPLWSKPTGKTSEELRALVIKARQRQQKRFTGTAISSNADCPGSHARNTFQCDDDAKTLLTTEAEKKQLSMRAADRCLKVARTIADLADSDSITCEHITEAVALI